MVLALVAPLAAYSVVALAPSAPAGKGAPPAASSAAAPPKASGAGAPASSAASGASPAASGATAPAGASPVAVSPAPAVSVDMSTRPADTQGVTGATYAVRLRDLEQRVDELKDQIRRSHTRLALLSDTIIGGGAAGSRSEVEFKNEMSSAFQLTHALFVMDGQVQYNPADEGGALADQKDIPIYSGSVPPGDHTIQVALTFQGNGYGVFSYLRGYKFEVKSSHAFTAVEGKTITITATSFEKGGVTTPLEQRPTIEWQVKLQPLAGGPPLAISPAPGAGSPVGGQK